MNLPIQAKSVTREASIAGYTSQSMTPSCIWCGPGKTCYGVCSILGCAGYCG